MHNYRIAYVAIPYTKLDGLTKTISAERSSKYSATLMENEILAYSPITLGHEMCAHSFVLTELESEAWQNWCKQLFSICNELHVICFKGWQESTGVQAEIEWAKELNMPIYLISEDLKQILHYRYSEFQGAQDGRK